jgi:hypothetical protein
MLRHAKAAGRNVLLRHGTVAAYLALLLASSTAAYAAATIGSAQVIDNSLKSVDLANGAAVGGVDVINDSLTGADVREESLNGVARAIIYREIPDQTVGPMKLVASAGGYDLLTDCRKARNFFLSMQLWVRGPSGAVQWHYSVWEKDNPNSGGQTGSYPGGASLPSGSATVVLRPVDFDPTNPRLFARPNEYTRFVGEWTVVSGASLVKFDLHGIIDDRSATQSCSIFGTAMKAA